MSNLSFIGNRDSFIKRSEFNEKGRWCKKHPTSFWGKDQFGDFYPKCVRGNRTQEVCEIGE